MSSWRATGPSDHDVVVRLMRALYTEDPSPFGMAEDKARRTLARLEAEPARGCAVLFEHAGAPAGYALLASVWSNELGGVICVVDELFVEPALRGRGLASGFLRALLERRAPWFGDAVAVELEVTPGNARARTLYERLGFATKKNATLRAQPR